LSELILKLEDINPQVFWGLNNQNFESLKQSYPKLKLIARGDELKAIGGDQDLDTFKEKMEQLFARFGHAQTIDASNFQHFLALPSKETKTESTKSAESEIPEDVIVYGPNGVVVKARTRNQKLLLESADKNDIIFAIGPAGTGKTYTAVALAVRALKNKKVKRIVLTRPAVEAGENLGFLPGDLKEKIDPYLRPLYDALDDMIPPEKLKVYLENRTIEIAPLAFMRGRTLDNAFVILDEAQNATDLQLKMFLTRMGPSAQFIITGDVTQIDLPKKQQSGLYKALEVLKDIQGIDIIKLSGEDVVRHKLVKAILKAYGDSE
jgi:phosphate starvation-inducible protein PhoH and related proteins